MDDFAKVLDRLTHIVRDFLFYFACGFIYLFITAVFVEKFVWPNSIHPSWAFQYPVGIAIVSYSLGHLFSAISFIRLFDTTEVFAKEMAVLKSCPEIYSAYIERYNTLYHFRKNLCVALIVFSLTSLATLVFELTKAETTGYFCQILVVFLLASGAAWIIGRNAQKTLESFKTRVEAAYKFNQDNLPKPN